MLGQTRPDAVPTAEVDLSDVAGETSCRDYSEVFAAAAAAKESCCLGQASPAQNPSTWKGRAHAKSHCLCLTTPAISVYKSSVSGQHDSIFVISPQYIDKPSPSSKWTKCSTCFTPKIKQMSSVVCYRSRRSSDCCTISHFASHLPVSPLLHYTVHALSV